MWLNQMPQMIIKVMTRKSNYIESNGLTNVAREKLKRARDGDKSPDRENRKRAGEKCYGK